MGVQSINLIFLVKKKYLYIHYEIAYYIGYSSIDLLYSRITKKTTSKIILTNIKCVQGFGKIFFFGDQRCKYSSWPYI